MSKTTKEMFFNKWNIHVNNESYYKRRFPQYVVDNKLDYKALDKEFTTRLELKLELANRLAGYRPQDIYGAFIGLPNYRQIATCWLNDLYRDNDKNRLIRDKAYETLKKIKEYLDE